MILQMSDANGTQKLNQLTVVLSEAMSASALIFPSVNECDAQKYTKRSNFKRNLSLIRTLRKEEKRRSANKNIFEKDFHKLMSNSFCCKAIENVRNRKIM